MVNTCTTYPKVENRGRSLHKNVVGQVMKDEDRMVIVKQIIEKNDHIYHTLLLGKIDEDNHMAKKTAERIIQKLLERGEIVSFVQKTRKCYMLKSHEAYKGDLPTMFARRSVAMKEKLDKIEKRLGAHSYESQLHMCDEFWNHMEDLIKRSDKWVQELDKDRGYEAEYEEIGSGIRKLLENTEIDRVRKRRVLSYSGNVVSALIRLGGEREELTEKRKTMKVSKEKEEMANRIKQLNEQIHIMFKDTVGLEFALKDLQSVDIEYWHDDTETGHLCASIDYIRKQSVECAEAMSGRVKKLTEIAGEQGMSAQVTNLDTQVSAIRTSLRMMDGTIKEIESAGQQYELLKTLDSELSEAESHLGMM